VLIRSLFHEESNFQNMFTVNRSWKHSAAQQDEANFEFMFQDIVSHDAENFCMPGMFHANAVKGAWSFHRWDEEN